MHFVYCPCERDLPYHTSVAHKYQATKICPKSRTWSTRSKITALIPGLHRVRDDLYLFRISLLG